ncbi:MAG: hypothetical protein R3D63_06635 [Paracoccaceae bacterium]
MTVAARSRDLGDLDVQGLIVAQPRDPTGTMLSQGALARLIHWAEARGGWPSSRTDPRAALWRPRGFGAGDQPEGLGHQQFLQQYFSMTGWRVRLDENGAERSGAAGRTRLAQNMFICRPHAGQIAALAAGLHG